MKQTISVIIGLALVGAALTVSAQQGQGRCAGGAGAGGAGAGGPHRYGAQKFPPPIAAVMDKDTNSVLSAQEIAQAPSELLKLDKNNDGQISAAELCPGGLGKGAQDCPWGGQGQGKGRRACADGQKSVLLALLDTDKDGSLGSAEINGAPAALKALDKDNDGQVTALEIRPLPGCGQGCPWKQNQAK